MTQRLTSVARASVTHATFTPSSAARVTTPLMASLQSAANSSRTLLTSGSIMTPMHTRNLHSVRSSLSFTQAKPSILGGRVQVHNTTKRYLNLHEYQSKELMAKYGIRVQKGAVASSVEEAEQIATRLAKENAKELIIKAQIHAGGRGKGYFIENKFKGGVQICTTPSEVKAHAQKMLGNTLVTKQTGPEGQKTSKVLVHEGISFDREMYFAILMDRQHNGPVLVASTAGGMDIEEVAEKTPEKIFTVPVDIKKGIQPAQTKLVAEKLGFKGKDLVDAQDQMKRLYEMFIGTDATQVEINPLVQTKDGKVYCVDAKINFDDNASFRQEALFAQRDFSMEDAREVAASKFNLNYIGLDGQIGCMVNGAGLAMATLDIIQLHGGKPANFLDVGGGASEKQVEAAFKILTGDPKVKAILVNIFGGIMKCDIIAAGIVAAAKNIKLSIPLIVRLEGTNVEKGNKILADSGIKLMTAADLDQAAIKAVASIAK
jgi:succinyl-CoA synthetase beta subunit